MLSLPISTSSYFQQEITLGGINYTFNFYFNERDKRWRFDIYDGETPIILGIKVMETQLFLRNYVLQDFDHGDIACIRFKNDNLPVGRDNLGFDKSYEILYLTNEELT